MDVATVRDSQRLSLTIDPSLRQMTRTQYNAGDAIDRSGQGPQGAKSFQDRRDDQSTPCRRLTMPPDFFKDNPFRRPQWRSERVIAMLTHRPRPLRPRRCDDRYMRAYRWFLKHYLAAGDDAVGRQRLVWKCRHVDQAHRLYFAADVERRQILEARLLTAESFAEIAMRFATKAAMIDYFEQLFFNVRDRMDCRDWLIRVIKGPPEDRVPSRDGVLTVGQRGYVYRLFGYYGGPKILDAVVMCTVAPPEATAGRRRMVRRRHARHCAIAGGDGGQSGPIDGDSVMRLLKLALREKAAGSAVPVPNQMSATDHETIFRELQRLSERSPRRQRRVRWNLVGQAGLPWPCRASRMGDAHRERGSIL